MHDEAYIENCFKLALKGEGTASPNPLVGCVVVRDGKIIGEGYHKKSGDHHAEVNAINSAEESVAGATLYSNLEPCCHKDKKTPPCTDFILKNKIKKVVISNLDPNPKVSGKGVEHLKSNGVEVVTDILKDKGEKINEIFFINMKKNRPFIHIKLAQSLDGKMCTSTGHSKWITDDDARVYVHRLRKKYDAVCVGKNTVLFDDPSLTIRKIGSEGKVPYRIVVGRFEDIEKNSQVFLDENSDKTIILSSEGENELCLENSFRDLYRKGITSVLVEGGPTLINSLLSKNYYDKVSIFIAPIMLGKAKSYFDKKIDFVKEAKKFNNGKFFNINNQVVFEGYSDVYGNC